MFGDGHRRVGRAAGEQFRDAGSEPGAVFGVQAFLPLGPAFPLTFTRVGVGQDAAGRRIGRQDLDRRGQPASRLYATPFARPGQGLGAWLAERNSTTARLNAAGCSRLG